MKRIIFISFIFLSILSCRKSDGKPSSTEIGSSVVDLDANTNLIRKKEALIGNFVCDALKIYFEEKGEVIDFVLVNGGNIRFNTQERPNGIYPKGILTSEMMDEMLPFENASYLVQVTGNQLKEILERSLAQYPLAKGPFMQCSKELSFKIDTLNAPQILNIDETSIQSHGSRIDSIFVNGISVLPNAVYNVLLPDYIAEGNDGYVTLRNISPSLKKYLSDYQASALKDYVLVNSPIEPKIEGRIVFK
ncbi:MAG: 5'-nucleotidase [Bacteroidota bacterium]